MKVNFYKLLLVSLSLLMIPSQTIYGQNSQWFHYGLFKTNCMVFFNGEMLVGSTEGIFAIDPDKYTSQKKYLVDENLNVVDLFKVGNKKLWCLTSEKLYFMENNILREYPLPENVRLEKGNFRQVCEGYNGKIYIGTTSGFFKGDSTKMEFCNSNEFASREVGVKEIFTHSSGKVIIHFGSANEQDWVLTLDRAGEFLLIDEKGAGSLKLIDNVLYVAMDSKANLYLASHNPRLYPEMGTLEKLSYVLNKKVFEGKLITILPISNKLGQKPPNYTSDHSVTKVDPQYRMISQQYSSFLFFIRFIDVDNNDKLLKYEDVGDCGGRWIPYTRAVYDDRNRSWFSSDRPIVRFGTSEKPENDVRLITKKPYFYDLYDLNTPPQRPLFVTSSKTDVFYAISFFLGHKNHKGWQLFDYETYSGINGLSTNKKGKSQVMVGSIGNCTQFSWLSSYRYDEVEPEEFGQECELYLSKSSGGSLGLKRLKYDYMDNDTTSELSYQLVSIGNNSGHSGRSFRVVGMPYFFEEVFRDQILVVTPGSVYINRDNYWTDLTDKIGSRGIIFYNATFLPDRKAIVATSEGLVEILVDGTVKKIQYPPGRADFGRVNMVKYDADGSLWVSANEGLFKLDNQRWSDYSPETRIQYIPARRIRGESSTLYNETPQVSFVSDKDNGTFISSLGGTYQFYSGKWRLLSGNLFGYLAFDHNGNLMIFHSVGVSLYNLTGVKNDSDFLNQNTILESQTTVQDIKMTPGSDSLEGMVYVEGGTFTMGSADRVSDEKPTLQVTLSSFYVGKTEVTQELWESIMGNNPSKFKGSKRPVEFVNWYDIVEFCNKLSEKEGLQKAYLGSGDNINCNFESNGYRLPTEAEWEYAARGGNKSNGYKYSGSNELDGVAWYFSNSGSETQDVGRKKQNELGLYDMSGNVWEWCWDWYGDYNSGSQTNPKGAGAGSLRVLRGGSWYFDAELSRVAYRNLYDPGFRYHNLGFRLTRTR